MAAASISVYASIQMKGSGVKRKSSKLEVGLGNPVKKRRCEKQDSICQEASPVKVSSDDPVEKTCSEKQDPVSVSDEVSSVDSGVVDGDRGVVSFPSPEPEKQSPEDAEHKKLGKLSKFRIEKATRKLLRTRGVKYLFPIQYLTFDPVYDGKDLIGQARTGTGKTLSFVLPLIEKLKAEGSLSTLRGRPPTVLVMAPTRELANQVYSEVKALAPEGMSSHCIYGGTPYDPQENAIRRGLDLLVGTPGRILDHMGRGALNLSQLRHVVLDEADQMLERGFAESVEEILVASFKDTISNGSTSPKPGSTPKPQLLLFSATVPSWVRQTADRYMTPDKVVVDLIGQQTLKTSVTVEHKAICCPYSERPSTIADVIQVYSGAHGRAMVFTPTKQEANELALSSALKQDCQVLHGDIPQKQREITLKGFREGGFQVLVATDVAARGLDIPEVDLVIQSEPPKDVDSYIHRCGRTGRAGRTGVNILFYKLQQERLVQAVEQKAGFSFQRIGAPQPIDIVKAGAKDAARSLDLVPACMLPHFKEAAEQLVREKGTVEVVASALAYISGAKEIISRSLLSAQQGFTTYLMHGDRVIRHVGYFWRILEHNFPARVKEAVKGLRMTKDERGVVFDLPSDLSSVIEENWEDGYVKLTTPTSLPELKERSQDYFERFRSNNTPRRYGARGGGDSRGSRRGGGGGGGGSWRGGGRGGSSSNRGSWRGGSGRGSRGGAGGRGFFVGQKH